MTLATGLVVLWILACWVLALAALVGWGLWGVRVRFLQTGEISLARAAWVGLVMVIGLLQVAHFFFPINGYVSAVLFAGGMAGLLANGRAVLARLRGRRPCAAQYLLVILGGIWLAVISIRPPLDYDTALYHLQSVRWTQSFPIVPGLGNLHGRLAYNTSADLLFASLSVGPWGAYLMQVSNGFVLLLLLVAAARAAQPGTSEPLFSLRWFWVLMIPAFAGWAIVVPGSLANDVLPFALVAVATAFVLEGMLSDGGSERARFGLLATAGLLAIASLTAKLAALAYAGVLVAGCVALVRSKERVRMMRVLCTGVVLLLLPWVGRNVVLSGCLVYPVAATRLPVSWAVPKPMIQWEAYAIHTWAMWDNWPPPNASALQWIKRMYWLTLYSFPSAALPGLLGIVFWRMGWRRARQWRGYVLALAAIAGMIFWLVTAPTIRFVAPICWLFAASGAAIAAERIAGANGVSRGGWKLAVAGAGMVIVALVIGMGSGYLLLHGDWKKGEPLMFLGEHVWARPGADGGLPELEAFPVATTRSAPVAEAATNGVEVHVPVGMSWEPPLKLIPYTHGQVGNAPLPASPYVHPGLRWRDPGNVGRGFAIDPGTPVESQARD